MYRRGTGTAHPHGGAPLLSTGMIHYHDNYRDHVHKDSTVVSLWLPVSPLISSCVLHRNVPTEKQDIMHHRRGF